MHFYEVIWLNKYILIGLGLWPMRLGTSLARRLFAHFRFVLGLFAVISLLVSVAMTVAAHWGDIGILGDFGSLIVISSLLILKTLYYFARQRSFDSTYRNLRDFWNITDDTLARRQYEQPAKMAKLATIIFFMAGIGDLLSFEAAALFTWIRSRSDVNESSLRRPFILELDYGFDTQQSPTYEIVHVWQIFSTFCGVSTQVGFDCIVMVFIVHVSAQFKFIACRFRAIGKKLQDDDDHFIIRVEIGKCVAQHQHTIRVAKELSALLSPVIFTQIGTSGVGICLGGFAVIYGDGGTVDIVKFLVLFASLLIQLLLWCAPAEYLIQESTAVGDAIYYDMPWFRFEPSLRRDLGFVMMRAQKGCHVTALYRVMSIRRITEVFNAAGSYLALLKSLKQ